MEVVVSALGDHAGVDALPAELRALRRWVLYRIAERGGKPRKVPYRPGEPGRMASVTDPDSWATFEQALAAQQPSGAAGIGFVFSAEDPYAGVDLDHCI